jgi:sulfur relay (sulfurtransferase) complex TusBCD TusD component (DsrE family)
VKLACAGSPVIEQLRALQTRGVELILCSTCLDYYGLTDRVAVGIVGGMPDIIEAMQLANKVISL